jgi:mono/diheme cytochrome c family protein
LRRRSPEGTVAIAVAASLLALLASAMPVAAQGVSFGPNHRVPRAHDTDIGADSTGDPHLDFMLHCQGCHQADGAGLEGAVPPLKDSVARLVTVPGGREYLSSVPGVAQSQLDDVAIAALLNWMVAYFDADHLPANFRPFTAEEVGPLRKHPLVQASVVRASLLARLR